MSRSLNAVRAAPVNSIFESLSDGFTNQNKEPTSHLKRLASKLLLLGVALQPYLLPMQVVDQSAKGALLVDGGGTTQPIRDRFVALAGGRDAKIVVIPTGASGIRFGEEKTVLDPDWPRDRPEWTAYETYLKKYLNADRITVIHTRDRAIANSDRFVQPLREANGVFLWPGNAGRYAQAYLGTRTQRELEALVQRGGVLFGSSAGAIILGSFTVRGRPDKPLLMPAGHTRGFGFLKNVAINPHLTQAKRENELVDVVDAHPEILGIGIDEDAALLVRGEVLEVIGSGKVAIYDNVRREGRWWYWLAPGERFDLAKRKKVAADGK